MLKSQSSILLLSRRLAWSRIQTTGTVSQSTSHVRHLSHKWSDPHYYELWTTQSIVTELQKANVRCTSSGIKALDAAYEFASTSGLDFYWTSSVILRGQLDLIRVGPIDVDTPDGINVDDCNVNRPGVRQWRSYKVMDACIDGKVYKLWEALYAHSEIFKEMIDEEEKELYKRYKSACCVPDLDLWRWMRGMVTEGFVERGDIDNLPEVKLANIIPAPNVKQAR
ncbi:hypothetical protein ABW21_db0206570 [Orbilia brochopaga]|nr:hypothetical protein ABW21_db0206570 [Drechslerella brochopaga]